MHRVRLILLLLLVGFVAVFLVLSWKNAVAVESISIRVKEGQREHLDHSLLKLGADQKLPDYNVKLRVTRRLLALNLGTRLNTSATNWLEFAVNERIPARDLQEIIISEDDTVENDELDRIQVRGEVWEGTAFQAQVKTGRSFEIGMNWFFSTPIGKAMLVAFILVLLGLAASIFRG